MGNFPVSPPKILVEEEKLILGVTSFEATNSVFIINDWNNSFSITIPGHWQSKSAEKNYQRTNEKRV